MKFKTTSLFILLIAAMFFGCVKNTNTPNNGSALDDVPTGHYTGTFQLVHLNTRTNKTDTATAAAFLLLNADGTFTLDGDTTKILAQGNGTYQANTNGTGSITFQDQTITKKTNLNGPKKHLNGLFLFTHNASNLRIYGASDTLYYNYVLIQN